METASVSSKSPDEQLVIVVHVDEGVSFNAAEFILIQSSLSGNKLESEPVKPGHTTSFDCNLVWETDRKSIKRMKNENLPVKIDCYALRNSKGKVEEPSREHIGYVLFAVKSIPIVPLSKALLTKPRWIKLIGLSKDWRPHKPELLMNVMITSKDFMTCDKAEVLESQGLESVDSFMIEENPVTCMLTSQRGIFIRLLEEEGLLQVGNIDTNCDVFLVKIVMKNLRFLDNLVQRDSSQEFYINYDLLGNQHTRPLDKKFNRSHQIQEKVSIKFRSSLSALQEYFEKIFYIPLEVMSGEKTLGSLEIKLSDLITITNLQEYLEKHSTSVCEIEGRCEIKLSHAMQSDENRPVLEFKASVQYIGTKQLHQTELLEKYKRCQQVDLQAGGDHMSEVHAKVVKSPSHEKRNPLSDIPEVRTESDASHQVKSVGVAKSHERHQSKEQMENECPTSELSHLFSFNLKLSQIKFNRKVEKGIWQFSFFHDKADTQRTFVNRDITSVAGDMLSFEDLDLKLYYTSTPSGIMELIESSNTCTICVKGPRGTHAQAELDCKSLLIGNRKQLGGNILMQNQINSINGMANVSASLEDLGMNHNSTVKTVLSQVVQERPGVQRSEMNVTHTVEDPKSAMLDDNLAYKMIEELSEWKAKQQENFISDLKLKETQYLEQLHDTWIQKQEKCEEDLVMKANQLNVLTKAMKDQQQQLKDKDRKQSRDGQELQTMKQELEKHFNSQLMAIRERARRMEDDLLHEIKLKDIRYEDNDRCLQHLKAENCELRQRNECLTAELNEVKGSSVPKHEVESLLQEMKLLKENCETLQQSKVFYKQEWAKAFRECHKIQRERIENSKDDFFNSNYESLCDALNDDHCKLNFDKQELEDIKQCLLLSDDELETM